MKTFERVIKDALLQRVNHKLNNEQHGFLSRRSCSSNLITFTDSLALSLNDNITVDVVYFDFAKAFDTVNHDILLHKLKNQYNINGRLLKFIASYLQGRMQCVVLGNNSSSCRPVISGVPQGSILGPILFVLFINDITSGLSPLTECALYADDTKIWRQVTNPEECTILQKDIDYMHSWANTNKMRFHPDKCKIMRVSNSRSSTIAENLGQFVYYIDSIHIEDTACEKDLGVYVNTKLNWVEHQNKILTKAKQKLGLMRRTCHFITNPNQRRILYMALVRSQFEHCSVVWRPVHKTYIDKIECLQKKCLKWVLGEEELSYSDHNVYINKCRKANVLPLSSRFELNDLLYLQKKIFRIIPLNLPNYISYYDGNSRLRNCHLDELCLVSSVQPKFNTSNISNEISRSSFANSFFYRAHLKWNTLPRDIRAIACPIKFKATLTRYFWDILKPGNPDPHWSYSDIDDPD